MLHPDVPENEAERLNALFECKILDTQAEPRYDRKTLLAKTYFQVAYCLISLVDENRQWFKSSQGLEVKETPRNISFCGHAILQNDILIVPNTLEDERFFDNPLVTGYPYIRFYAGAILKSTKGLRLGTLCIIDTKPRSLSSQDLEILRDIADSIETELHRDLQKKEAKQLTKIRHINAGIAKTQSVFIHHKNPIQAFWVLLDEYLRISEGQVGILLHMINLEHNELEVLAQSNPLDTVRPRFNQNHLQPLHVILPTLKSLGLQAAQQNKIIEFQPQKRSTNLFLLIPIVIEKQVIAVTGLAKVNQPFDLNIAQLLNPINLTFGQLLQVTKTQKAKKASENELNRTHHFLSNLLQATTAVSIIAVNAEGEITHFNQGAEKLLNYSAKEAIGALNITKIHQKEELSERSLKLSIEHKHVISDFKALVFEAETKGFEQRVWTYLDRHGNAIMVSVVVTVVRDTINSSVLGYLCVAQNISDLHKQQTELKKTWALLECCNHVAQIGHWEIDFSLQTIFWSDISKVIHDVSPDYQPNLQTAIDFYLEGKDRNAVTQAIEHSMQHHTAWDISDLRIVSEKGVIKTVRIIGTPIIEKGICVKIFGIIQDLSKIKQAELQLKEQSEYNQAIIDNIIDGIVISDQKGIIKSANPAIVRIFNFENHELIGNSINLLMPKHMQNHHDHYMKKYSNNPISRKIGMPRELLGMKKDGKEFPIEITVTEIFKSGQKHFIAILRDITERSANENLKKEFISVISHELRTPITAIIGAVKIALHGNKNDIPEHIVNLLTLAQRNSERLNYLINDLLDLDKLTSGKLYFRYSKFCILGLSQQVIETMATYLPEKNITLELKHTILENPPYLYAQADRDRVNQVLNNLLSNAIKFSPKNSSVILDVSDADGFIRVKVIDHGPGVPEEFRSRIFEKFSQLDSTDSRQSGGSGLGLAISKALVEKMGGTIGYKKTESHQGSQFFFSLIKAN